MCQTHYYKKHKYTYMETITLTTKETGRVNVLTQLNWTLTHRNKIQEYMTKLAVRNMGWTERQRNCTNKCSSGI